MQNNVSVNIINWNGIKYLTSCLESVYAQDYPGGIEVVIVDNASTDGSINSIKEKYPKVKLLFNHDNLGFCKAHNQAFRLNSSKYCLPLNFDVTLNKNFISEMVAAMNYENDIGMVSGKLYRLDGGLNSSVFDTTGIEMPYYFQRPRGQLEIDRGQYDKMGYVFGPCGAAPLYKREMLEDIKINGEYFDEGFVNYVEDVDLAWRAQLRGWKCLYAPKAVAYHFRGSTRVNNNEVRSGYYLIGYRNRYWALYKNITREEFRRNFLKILLKETAFLLTKKPGECSRIIPFRSLIAAFKGRNKMQGKRRIIQSKISVSSDYMDSFFQFGRFRVHSYVFFLLSSFMRRAIINKVLISYNLLKRCFRFCLKPFVPAFRKK